MLQRLEDRYGSDGLRVLGFPCNDFGNEEPGSLATIQAFCNREYGATYELMDKVTIRPGKGRTIHPLYEWLTAQGHEAGPVKWNFEKFVINRRGTMVARFAPDVQPDHPAVITAMRSALKRPA